MFVYIYISPEDRKQPLVAGSVGPYGAFLHDGSEYTGAYEAGMSVEVRHSMTQDCISCTCHMTQPPT